MPLLDWESAMGLRMPIPVLAHMITRRGCSGTNVYSVPIGSCWPRPAYALALT